MEAAPASLQPDEKSPPGGVPNFFEPLVKLMDRQIPPELASTPEDLRRSKLEPDPDQPQYFLTVHGTGYRFVG